LAEAGPAALAPLRDALARAPSAHRGRLRAALDRAEAAQVLSPMRISLKVRDARLAAVLRALSDQSGVSLLHAQRPGAGAAKPVTLELNDVTFWEALDRLCEKAGLSWSQYGLGEVSVFESKGPAPGRETTYAGPFRIQARSWLSSYSLSPSPVNVDGLRLNLDIVGQPSRGLLTTGAPRVIEARTAAGESLVPPEVPPAMNFTNPSFGWTWREVLLKRPAKQGGTLRLLKGALPVEVQVEPRPLLEVENLPKAAGKLYTLESGFRMQVDSVAVQDRRVVLQLAFLSAATSFDLRSLDFAVSDAKGRNYLPSNAPWTRPLADRFRATDALLLSGGASAGGLGALPWFGIAFRGTSRVPTAWGVTVSFTAPEGVGPPSRLTLSQFRRVKAEVPFEFHDLPLP
jgi:hypothetical protein